MFIYKYIFMLLFCTFKLNVSYTVLVVFVRSGGNVFIEPTLSYEYFHILQLIQAVSWTGLIWIILELDSEN